MAMRRYPANYHKDWSNGVEMHKEQMNKQTNIQTFCFIYILADVPGDAREFKGVVSDSGIIDKNFKWVKFQIQVIENLYSFKFFEFQF